MSRARPDRWGPGTVKEPPNPMSIAIPSEQIAAKLFELITVVASIPESERAAWYRSIETYSRLPHPGHVYNMPKVAGIFKRLADIAWPEWPLHEERED